MQPGIYKDLSNADYHGGPGISKSGLDLIHRSPMHFKAARDAGNDNHQPTPAQAFGTAFHALVLEPEEFHKHYTLGLRRSDVPEAIEDRDALAAMVQELNQSRLPKLPTSGTKAELIARIMEAEKLAFDAGALDVVLVSSREELEEKKLPELKASIEAINEGRPGHLPLSGNRHELADLLRANGKKVQLWSDVLTEWERNNQGRTVLTQDQWDTLHAMREAVEAHPAAKALLSAPGDAEMSVYWRDPVSDALCRCRPDYWRHDGILVDLKTCEDASPEGFAKSVAGWRYHVQHPYYMDGIELMRHQAKRLDIAKPKAFVFIAVEKKFPHAVGVYVLDDASVEIGRAEYQADLNLYAECDQADKWPGYPDKITSISLPKWALNKGADLLAAA